MRPLTARSTALRCLAGALALSLAALGASGCGSGSSAAPSATALSYRDPTGQGWRLVRDPASTPRRLVLDLVGPAGLLTRGAAFNLVAPEGVRFGKFESSGFPIEDAGVYELENTQPVGDPDPLEPVLLAGGVKGGNLLTAGIFQKDRRATAKESGVPLARIAIELPEGASLASGEALPLTVTKAKYVAEDIGAFDWTATREMVEKSRPVDFDLAVGTLVAE